MTTGLPCSSGCRCCSIAAKNASMSTMQDSPHAYPPDEEVRCQRLLPSRAAPVTIHAFIKTSYMLAKNAALIRNKRMRPVLSSLYRTDILSAHLGSSAPAYRGVREWPALGRCVSLQRAPAASAVVNSCPERGRAPPAPRLALSVIRACGRRSHCKRRSPPLPLSQWLPARRCHMHPSR
jgi:hypothetical protein